jgi:citrate lyase subunit beta/citryl-CoA lyase
MNTADAASHPRSILFDAGEPQPPQLPVCDHYAGVEARMRKSLALQAELGPVFDVTLDLEDGAPVGGEREHAALIAEMLGSADNRFGRVGVRLPQADHPAFDDCARRVLGAARPAAYLMCPKLRGATELDTIAVRLDALAAPLGRAVPPLHGLIETHGALRDVQAIAGHARIESLSFGLMDFVSAHRGAIPRSAMTADGQFDHPLVVRAKLEIAAACHAAAKVPSHCVVTEFRDTEALADAARMAGRMLGYTRMWSIHPAQIRPIVDAFAPTVAEIDEAAEILGAAAAAGWAPISHRHGGQDTLHDRASYRYFWQVLERAARTSLPGTPALPGELRARWFATEAAP